MMSAVSEDDKCLPPQQDGTTATDKPTTTTTTTTKTNWRARTAAALERQRKLLEAQKAARRMQQVQEQALEDKQQDSKPNRLAKGLHTIGNALQKINIGKWIDDLEKDQELADELDRLNDENNQEAARLAICRQAVAACRKAMQEHLTSFLLEYPTASYDDWIRDLHPDNVHATKNEIDARFYIPNCEHLQLWKDAHPDGADGQGLVEEHLSERSTQDHETPIVEQVNPTTSSTTTTTTTTTTITTK